MGQGRSRVVISSRRNQAFLRIRRLAASGRARKREGLCLMEGEKLVAAAMSALGPPRTLLLAPSSVEDEDVAALAGRCHPASILVLERDLFRDISTLAAPAPVMAVTEIPPFEDPGPGTDRLLLDGLQDPGNLGMILRSAAAAGVKAVLLSQDCADPWSPKVLRAGMGAHFHLSIGTDLDLAEEAGRFTGKVIALDHRGEQSLYEEDLTGPAAFVIGAEGRGVSSPLLESAKRRVAIPMPGWGEPLNAAAAATICLFEMVRQRG